MVRFFSSTREVPVSGAVPKHVVMIMDGNGRWAKKRFLPRFAGHKKGLDTVREMVRQCLSLNIEYLTLFAFSSENWRRPAEEVGVLMQLFESALQQEVEKLSKNGVRLRVVGDLSRFSDKIQSLVNAAESETAGNTRLNLTIAANYGGRWDIAQAVNRCLAGRQAGTPVSEEDIESHLALAFAPEPDLFIRTGGEQRVSNFLLWQLAYTELYFTDLLWPEFDAEALTKALGSFQQRQRRFGLTGDQLAAKEGKGSDA